MDGTINDRNSAGSSVMAVLSRDDLRQELNSCIVETCGKQLQELGAKVLKDMQQELRSFIDAEHMMHPRITPRGHLSVPGTPPCGLSSMSSGVSVGSANRHTLIVSHDGSGFQLPPEFNPRDLKDAVQKGRSASHQRHSEAHESVVHKKSKPKEAGLGPAAAVPLREAGQAQVVASECWMGTDEENARLTSPGLPGAVEEEDKGGGEGHGKMIEVKAASTPEFQSTSEESQRSRQTSNGKTSDLMVKWQSLKTSLETVGFYGQKARRIVESAYFDYVFGTLLIMNGIVIGAETNERASSSDTSSPVGYKVLNMFFCLAFSTELGLRLLAYKRRLYTMRGFQWNIFDTFIVGIQILDQLTSLLFDDSAVQGGIEDIGVIRVLRLGRVVRLVRMVRLIPELKSMVYLIFASMSSFLWAMVLIVLLMYCVAVFYVDTSDKLVKDVTLDLNVDEIKLYWASVERAMLTLFQALTSGNDWHNFIDCFNGAGDAAFLLNALAFSLYVSFGMLVMLNLVTGVFVEGAQRIVKRDKDADLMRTVCKVFGEVDDDESMCLSYPEFMSHLGDGSLDPYFQALDLNKSQAKGLFALLDDDGDQVLSMKEFVFGCMRLRGPARAIDLAAFSTDMQVLVARLRSDTEEAIASLRPRKDTSDSPLPRLRPHKDTSDSPLQVHSKLADWEGPPTVCVQPAGHSAADS